MGTLWIAGAIRVGGTAAWNPQAQGHGFRRQGIVRTTARGFLVVELRFYEPGHFK